MVFASADRELLIFAIFPELVRGVRLFLNESTDLTSFSRTRQRG